MNARDLERFAGLMAERLGVPAPRVSAGGDVAFGAILDGERVTVTGFAHDDLGVIALSAAVGRMPDDGPTRKAALELIVAANAFGAATSGLTLALSPADQSIQVGYALLPGCTGFEQFRVAFERVAVGAAAWRRRFAALEATRAPA